MTRRRLVVATALAIVGAGCASAPGPAPREKRAGAPPVVVQALHRAARPDGSALRPDAAQVAADTALATLTGAPPPLEPWTFFEGRHGAVAVVALPGAGRVARAVHERFQTIAERPDEVLLIDGPPGAVSPPRRARVVVVVRPDWVDGRVEPDPALAARALQSTGWPTPSLVLVDLFEPLIDGQRWPADEVLASRDVDAAAAAVRWVLATRSQGRPPGPSAPVFSDLARGPADLEWMRVAIPR